MKSVVKYFLPVLVFSVLVAGAHIYSAPDRPLAFVQKFKPSVAIKNQGALKNIKKRGKPLFNGDTLRTNKDGFALVQFMDKSLAKIKPDSRLIVRGEVEDKSNTSTRIGLELGEIFLNVSKQGADNFEVATKTSVASVKGTKFGASAEDYFWVEEGEVEVTVSSSGASVTLGDKSYGQVTEDGSIESGELSDEELQKNNEDFAGMDDQMEPENYKLRFVDENGQERVIEVQVYENQN